jgi:hypothetical protein
VRAAPALLLSGALAGCILDWSDRPDGAGRDLAVHERRALEAARPDAARDLLQLDRARCTPAPETCNGKDDDCDGWADNGLLAAGCWDVEAEFSKADFSIPAQSMMFGEFAVIQARTKALIEKEDYTYAQGQFASPCEGISSSRAWHVERKRGADINHPRVLVRGESGVNDALGNCKQVKGGEVCEGWLQVNLARWSPKLVKCEVSPGAECAITSGKVSWKSIGKCSKGCCDCPGAARVDIEIALERK